MKTKLFLLAAILILPSLASAVVVAGWGDSLTAGTGAPVGMSYLDQFHILSGEPVYRQGWGGKDSTYIKDQFLLQPAHWGDYAIIWSGRNNYTDTATVKADIAAMVAKLTTPNYLILSIINGNYASEYQGQANYNTMLSLNADLAATYGSRFIDVRKALVDSYNPLLPQDVTDFDRDTVPDSLRADNIHLTAAGYGIVAKAVYDRYSTIPEPGSVVLIGLAPGRLVSCIFEGRPSDPNGGRFINLNATEGLTAD